jgi:hypothetical protein
MSNNVHENVVTHIPYFDKDVVEIPIPEARLEADRQSAR